MESALEGIKVLDLSRHIAGPYCSSLLADMGAEVIRIEVPGGDSDRRIGYLSPTGDSYAFINRMRNKKAITLNLRKDEGKEIFRRLVEKADIVLENYAVKDKERLGLTFESLLQINPSIILASVSAFGLTGPNTERIGFDPIAQAMAGALTINGFPGDPPVRSAVAWVDFATATHTAYGILLALRYRDHTGKGQRVDVSLADVAAGLMAIHGIYTEYEKTGVERPQTGNMSPYSFSDTFQARDGWVFISLTRDGVFKRFLRAAGMEETGSDPRFGSDWKRAQNKDALYRLIAPWVEDKRAAEVVSILERAKVPCSEINSVKKAFSEPQYRDRDILMDVEHPGAGKLSTLGTLVKLTETPGKIKSGTPPVGQNNEEIYKDLLGLTDLEFSGLKRDNII